MTSARASTEPRALPRPELTISVNGVAPIGQGAITGGGSHTDAKGTVTRRAARHKNAKDLDPWRNAVQLAAQVAMARAGWTTVAKPAAVELSATFYLPRPKSVPIAARPLPTVSAPGIFDLSHLYRAIEDACTKAGVWQDDSQVTDYGQSAKRYADYRSPGVVITVREIGDDW